uniref:VWFA domain-containing protein n=1 Tax=Candidatus Kentrum eta TaxID=2126337 RepID=A0A450UDU3_9GAMM|nr:MAG: hypothetical protein BECKH772A_GA0070896_1002316 [Candidatus Kentron sp. H]VFJ91787.1 MAG: hypothetical protein BECKH772B_GA0070898_1002116 [Candidatus Kentron sp. H]VFJ98418.1 MAG: hypothetical protein BECKH772C_GA0070978_1002116 [Candidatus Kentron sp. H]
MFSSRTLLKTLFIAATLWLATPVNAELITVESCYDRISAASDRPAPERVLYVLIDQTTPWIKRDSNETEKGTDPISERMAEHISRLVSGWPQHSDMVYVITFSAISEGRDVAEAFSVRTDGLPPESVENHWRQSQIRAFKACFRNQSLKARIAIKRGTRHILEQADSSIGRSEILQSLHRFATTRLQQQTDAEITILVASDLLENSSIMSFYQGGDTFAIDDEAALEYANQVGLIPDFHGAKVFGIGLGLGSSLLKSFTGTQSVAAFWEGYFREGHGGLIELGRPTLQRKALN